MSDDKKRADGSETGDLSRRDWIRISTGSVLIAAASMSGCSKHSGSEKGGGGSATVVRVASVPTAVDGNLLPTLVGDFEKGAPDRVELTSHEDVYGLARAGKADLVISHFGHRDAEAFVLGGFGDWPRTLFSNQMALLGPPEDPAMIRGLEDAGEAFRRIAATKSPFVVNHIDGVRYLTEVLWNAAGRPDRAGWLFDEGRQKEDAIRFASDKGAYAFWGLTPFLRLGKQTALHLEPLVVSDPLLQRMLVSIVVKSNASASANVAGARALQSYLLSPATQARIREVRYPGAVAVQWVPGARHNRTDILPMG